MKFRFYIKDVTFAVLEADTSESAKEKFAVLAGFNNWGALKYQAETYSGGLRLLVANEIE